MADRDSRQILQVIAEIKKALREFNASLPEIQRQTFAKVVELSRGLDITNDRIRSNIRNVRQIDRIKRELEGIILSPAYKRQVGRLLAAYDTIDRINGEYFSTISAKYRPSSVFKRLRVSLIDETIEGLTEAGIEVNITNRARDILQDSVTGGGRFTDYVDEMRRFLTDTRRGDGSLARYAETYATDSLNQYNAHYNQAAVADLGLVWYRYAGSLKETSREWCIRLIEAKKGSDPCLPFIHKSQLGKLARGVICGRQVPLYSKTGLPHGMMAGTNGDNLVIRRGGHNCGHQLYPVSSAVVPQELRERYE